MIAENILAHSIQNRYSRRLHVSCTFEISNAGRDSQFVNRRMTQSNDHKVYRWWKPFSECRDCIDHIVSRLILMQLITRVHTAILAQWIEGAMVTSLSHRKIFCTLSINSKMFTVGVVNVHLPVRTYLMSNKCTAYIPIPNADSHCCVIFSHTCFAVVEVISCGNNLVWHVRH